MTEQNGSTTNNGAPAISERQTPVPVLDAAQAHGFVVTRLISPCCRTPQVLRPPGRNGRVKPGGS
jgi:hypothetical protein